MALQFSLTSKQGATHPAAYCRVVNFSGDIDNISITTITHISNAARIANKEEVETETFVVPAPVSLAPLTEPNWITWCYNQIKTNPYFDGFIDV